MATNVCLVCNSSFYVKPSHIKKGWGKYCSKLCQNKAQKTGLDVSCTTCGKSFYRNALEIVRSKSGKYFCCKSCQTIWRNEQYSGELHSNWSGGKASYRAKLLRSELKQQCSKCGTLDRRVLAVHHRDKNRWNNSLFNLMWLCHNCHYLVHHDKREAIGFLVPVA